MKLLIIEDDENLRELTRQYFTRRNFLVEVAQDGKNALKLIFLNKYDCILLDLNLPEVDGIEVSKRIRAEKINVPIIILTARSQIYNKLEGFETGADDYITKPFDMKELLARVKAVIRRSSNNKDLVLEFNNMLVFPEKNKLIKKNGEEITLSNKEMWILEYILRNKGRIVPAEELLEHGWDREADLFSNTVKTHIKTLRKKIDPYKKHLKTVRGKGYIFEK